MNRSSQNYLFLSLLMFCGLSLAACSKNKENVTAPSSTLASSAIIVIPGFKGSLLGDHTGEMTWITTENALFGGGSLALAGEQFGIENSKTLVSKKIIDRVTIVPAIYRYDVYGSFIHKLRKNFPSAEIIDFHYDWREDNFQAINQLANLVTSLEQRGIKKISIVAHSMGGLIAFYYLRYGAQPFTTAQENWLGATKIDRLVIAGVPFLGAMAIVNDLKLGLRVGLNSSLLTAESYGTFPSSYQLLPYGQERPKNLPLHNLSFWKAEQLGLFSNIENLSAKQLTKREHFVALQLLQSKQFLDLIHADVIRPPTASTKIFNIIGVGRATLVAADFKQNGTSELAFSADHLYSKHGDWLVSKKSAQVPSLYSQVLSIKTVESEACHGALLSASENSQKIVNFF